MTAKLDNKARQMLKGAKLYCTQARIAILRALLETARPLRHDQISPGLEEQTFNKVTVYRTLESLVEAGLVHRAFTY